MGMGHCVRDGTQILLRAQRVFQRPDEICSMRREDDAGKKGYQGFGEVVPFLAKVGYQATEVKSAHRRDVSATRSITTG